MSCQQHVDDDCQAVGFCELRRCLEGCHQDDTQTTQQVADEGDVDLAMVLQMTSRMSTHDVGPLMVWFA